MTGATGAAVGAVLPQWQQAFGVRGELSWYFNLLFAGAILGILLSSRMRRRHPWLSLALLGEGVGLGVFALTPEVWGIFGGAFLLGIGVAIANFHCNALPLDLYRTGQAVVLNRISAAFGVGAVLAPLLMVWLPWRLAYGLLAGVAVAAAALLWKAPPPPAPTPQSGSLQGLLPYVLGATVTYVAAELVVSSFSGLYLRHLNYEPRLVGVLLSLFWVAFTLGRLGLAALMAERPLVRLLGLHLLALGTVACYLVPPLAWAFPLLGFLLAPTFPTLYSFAREAIGPHTATHLFYAGAVGANLIPAAFAWMPPGALGWGMLGVMAWMALATHLLRSQHEAASPALRS
jgi:fucose permease